MPNLQKSLAFGFGVLYIKFARSIRRQAASCVGWSIFFRLFIRCSEVSAVAGRKRWRWNLLGGQSAAAILLSVLFALGCLGGCVAATLVRDPGGDLLSYVRRYLELVVQDAFSPDVWSVFWRTVFFALAVTIFGFTALGVAGIPLLFLYKGFALCYAVSVFYRLFGAEGVGLAGVLFAVSAFLWLPAVLELGARGLLGSYGLLRRAMGSGRYPLGYDGALIWFGLCAGMLVLCVCIECIAVPILLQKIAGKYFVG